MKEIITRKILALFSIILLFSISFSTSFAQISDEWWENHVDWVSTQLADPNESVRQLGIDSLNKVKPNEAIGLIPLFIEKLKETDSAKKRANIRNGLKILKDKVGSDDSLIPDLINLMVEENEVGTIASTILISYGVKTFPALFEIIGNKYQSAKMRREAAYIISMNGDLSKVQDADLFEKQLTELRGFFHSEKDDEVKFWLAVILAKNKNEPKSVYQELLKKIEGSDPAKRREAAYAIEKIAAHVEIDSQRLFGIFSREKERFDYAKNDYDEWHSLFANASDKDSGFSYNNEKADNQYVYKVVNSAFTRAALARTLAICEEDKEKVSDILFKMLEEPSLTVKNHQAAAPYSYYIDYGSQGADILPAFKYVGGFAVPQIMKKSNDNPDYRMRSTLIRAITYIGEPAKFTIPFLINQFDKKDESYFLRTEIVNALGKVGSAKPDTVIPKLIAIHKSRNLKLDFQASEALASVATQLALNNKIEFIPLLEDAQAEVATNDNEEVKKNADTVKLSIEKLDIAWWEQNFWTPLKNNFIFLLPILFFLILLIICLLLFWVRPRYLFEINQRIANIPLDTRVFALGILNTPLRYALIIGFFHYKPRVLDAWLNEYITNTKTVFFKRKTIKERENHINVPIELNDEKKDSLKLNDLKPLFKEPITFLKVLGDGGIGKTSMACIIARWALEANRDERLSTHYMLPVIIEQGNELLTGSGGNNVEEIIKQQIGRYAMQTKPLSSELIHNLIGHKRILIIVDGFSEMTDTVREKILNDLAVLAANNVILTSRRNEDSGDSETATIKPVKIGGKFLSSFFESYLDIKGVKEEFKDDHFILCDKLLLLINDNEVTPLFVKLFADLQIQAQHSARKGASLSNIPKNVPEEEYSPQNIPDLVLYYINCLNREFDSKKKTDENKINNETVQDIAKIIAWQCLKNTLTPSLSKKNEIIEHLEKELEKRKWKLPDVELPISHLEKNLNLIRQIGVSREDIRFMIDPLAEYLASMYFTEMLGKDDIKWKIFISALKKNKQLSERIIGFIYALQDCCSTKYKNSISEFVPKEMAKAAGIKLANKKKQNSQRRANRIIQDLKLVDSNEFVIIKDEISSLEKQLTY